MTLDILTAASVNGMITGGRGQVSTDLISRLRTPPEVLEAKRSIRRRYDAVMVGTGTVLVNNPTLTSHAMPDRPATRVTLDPAGKIPPHYRFLDGSARTLVGVSAATPVAYLDLLAERRIEAVPAGEERVDLALFLRALAGRGIDNLVVEGGGILNRSLLALGLVDHLHLLLLPAVLDAGSVNLFEGGAGSLARLRLESCEPLGDYVLLRYAVAA
ncbi:MAG TPA: dihydrofolate reductase family protein [Thermoanaerobaculia bacterium]|nr:dihydrofolate reductase family protein [Thermoanaerobaculia bacterium]